MVQDSTRVPSIGILLTIHIVHAKENGEEMIPKQKKRSEQKEWEIAEYDRKSSLTPTQNGKTK